MNCQASGGNEKTVAKFAGDPKNIWRIRRNKKEKNDFSKCGIFFPRYVFP